MATPNINFAEAKVNAHRCKEIKNKRTGNVFPRNEESPSAWYMLFERALLHPEEFEVVFEEAPVEKKMGVFFYTEGELKGMTVPRLRKIALEYEITGDSKEELIRGIIEAQVKMNRG